jgi:hypothetical protein
VRLPGSYARASALAVAAGLVLGLAGWIDDLYLVR